ncbi:MAG: leucine-rich repeat domain-containing protein [Ruminococcus sp.]|nr:leucine-rich repeat domain-containing protein [Ruminococcus sp.]
MDLLIKNGKLIRALGKGSDEYVQIPDTVTAIGDNAFYDTRIIGATLPETVTSIGLGAFGGCGRLENINIPAAVGYIGREAFDSCFLLGEITIPRRVTRLNDGCFKDCHALRTIVLHENIIYGSDVFLDCTSVSRVEIGSIGIIGRSLRHALAREPNCIERLTRAVRYGTIPDRMYPAVTAQLAAQLYLQKGSGDAKKYLGKNALNVFKYLAEDGRTDLLVKLAGESDIVSRDIDALIEAAIAAEQHEVYIMLADLRHSTLPCETLSDRFAL